METIWDFIKAMTIWNWITLIAFIFFPLSALNAFFSLKGRFLDWRGTKNKELYKKRLEQLERQLSQIEEYKKDSSKLFFKTLENGIRSLLFFFGSFFFFMWAFFISVSPFGHVTLP